MLARSAKPPIPGRHRRQPLAAVGAHTGDGAPRAGSERGAGIISTLFGFTAFLFLVLFTAQVMVALYARSTITAIAYDAARRAAEGTDEAAAAAWATQHMGHRCDHHTCFTWQSTPDAVVLVVDVPQAGSLVPAPIRRPMGIDHVQRTFVVRRESRFR